MLWRRLDQPGHEAAKLVFHAPFWQLGGNAVFAHEGQPCRLEYLVVCDAAWHTLHARVIGWVGVQQIGIELSASADRDWRLNGDQCPAVRGCMDLDLAFSPSTNLLPIRRLGLKRGEEAEVRAAWLRFPGFTLEPLVQVYRRTGDTRYRYEAAGQRLATELELDSVGFVMRYPGLWEVESAV